MAIKDNVSAAWPIITHILETSVPDSTGLLGFVASEFMDIERREILQKLTSDGYTGIRLEFVNNGLRLYTTGEERNFPQKAPVLPFTGDELRRATEFVPDGDVLFTAVLAGMLNAHLKQNAMQLVHRKDHEDVTYNILRFDIKAVEGDHNPWNGRRANIKLVAVINEPYFTYETNPVETPKTNFSSEIFAELRNEGYTDPTVAEPVEERGSRDQRNWGRVSVDSDSYSHIIRLHTDLMRLCSKVFQRGVPVTKPLAIAEIVMKGIDLRGDTFPNWPVYQVVAQVAPFIHYDQHGYNQGVMDTIIKSQGFATKEEYAHSSDLLTIDEYQERLLRPLPRRDWDFMRTEPKGFIVDEVLKKIPAELAKGNPFNR